MSLAENKEIVWKYDDEAYNKGNVAVVDQYHPAGFRFGGVHSLEAIKEVIRAYHESIPDFHITHQECIAEGDMVAYRWTVTGTNRGPLIHPLLGVMPPTGEPFTCTGITIKRVKDGKFVEDSDVSNWTDMLIEMGVNPIPEVAKNK